MGSASEPSLRQADLADTARRGKTLGGGPGTVTGTRREAMKKTAFMLLALGLPVVGSRAAFAQNDSCGTPTRTQAWSEALAQHGQFTSGDERIKFTIGFIYKSCSGGDVVELPQTVIGLCNFNKSIVRMDPEYVACVLVPRSD